VNIPFEFVAGKLTLPAGEYRVEKLEKNSVVVLTHCTQPGASAVVMTIAAQANEPQSDSKLVFNRYGNLYFLSQYWMAGSSRGRLLLKSAREEEISRIARIEARDKSPWSPASPQPRDNAPPASPVVTARESRATPSGFPFCFLNALPFLSGCESKI